MPRKALTCTVELDVYQITCPGTRHLNDRNMLYLSVCILGQTKRTKSVFASFPLALNERMYFERTFVNAREPTHVMGILEDEHVLFELVQYSDVYRGGKVLARYEISAREFLYPTPTLTGKDGVERELLLSRTVHFTGIDPKLEFSSNSTIHETTVPGTYAELTSVWNGDESASDSESEGTSETEEELILNPTPRHLSHSLYAREYHCVCECPRRPENNGRVTLRSRSLSPSRRPKSATPSVRPPFKAGKADERIISRRDFLKPGRSRQRSRTAYVEGNPAPCPDCRVPHKDCVVCQAYLKVYGRDFLKHRFGHELHRRTSSTPAYTSFASEPPRVRARLPENDVLNESKAYSEPIPRSRRIFPRENGYGSFLSSPNRESLMTRYASPVPSYRSRQLPEMSDSDEDDTDSMLSLQELRSEINDARLESLDRSFEDPEHPTLGTRLDRSITVPLSQDKFWSSRMAEFTGRSHRALFDESLQELYTDLYNKARDL
ncbi:spermatogenesis-associated protein 6-like isoform X1 [Porites lutea]|uniref:spermatogenesis-associated protein 6-like isoform X1 n=2 Tax=Porites lutea TaxID=51062 RepID=UPI003CC5FD22